jgi:NitT/TauT family transport system ATP-binding protein
VFLGSQRALPTAGPARLADHFAIDLPYPRHVELKATQKSGAYTKHIYHLLGME